MPRPDFQVGDRVIHKRGLFGEEPVEIREVLSAKGSLIVKVKLFGDAIDTEMSMDDAIKYDHDQ